MGVLKGKCIIVGDSTVGKTAVTQSFCSDGATYPKNYNMSTGIELLQKFIHLGDDYKEAVDMFMFDSAGKVIFKDMTELHWEKLGMYAIIFDVTDKNSFTNCQKWLKKLKSYIEPNKMIPGVLIGNKADLEQRRKVTAEEAQTFANNNALTYFECSAKDYNGIEAPFRWLATKFYETYKESPDAIQELE